MDATKNKFPFDSKSILLDTCSNCVSAAFANEGEILHQESLQGFALENIFNLLLKLKKESGFEFAEIKAFALCAGVGGVLGVRTASAALSTLAYSNNLSGIYTWSLMETAADKTKKTCGKNDFYIVIPSRKNFLNMVLIENSNQTNFEISYEEFLEKFENSKHRKFFIKQREILDDRLKFINSFENPMLSLRDVFYAAKNSEINFTFSATPPDAISIKKQEYVKWNSQARI